MENKDKYICPGKDICKKKGCIHAKPHKHDSSHCYGSNCYVMRGFEVNIDTEKLKSLLNLVCVKIEGGKKK